MAIDTRNKRSSAINVGSPWRSMLPAPDGTIGQGDRQHVAFMYSGIAAATVTPPDSQGTFTARHRADAWTARRRREIWTAPPRIDTQTR